MTLSQEKIDNIVEAAETVFWQSVAAAIPSAKSGDISPDSYYNLNRAMREALAEWIDFNTPENKTVEVLLHNVEYWFKGSDLEIDDSGMEHIAYMISQGYNQGELYIAIPDDEDGNTLSGWWTIKK